MADLNATLLVLIDQGVAITPELIRALNGQTAAVPPPAVAPTPLTHAQVKAERERMYPAHKCVCGTLIEAGHGFNGRPAKYCKPCGKIAFEKAKAVWAARKAESTKKAEYNAALFRRSAEAGAKSAPTPSLSTRIVIRPANSSFAHWVKKHVTGVTSNPYGGIEYTVASEGAGKAAVEVLRKECVGAELISVPRV